MHVVCTRGVCTTWFIRVVSGISGERLETEREFICDCLITEYPVHIGGERLETEREFNAPPRYTADDPG